jgi:hypothetical protein
MIFNLFHYCEGFIKAPTMDGANPIDNAIQQSNNTTDSSANVNPDESKQNPVQPNGDNDDNFTPVIQEDADVNSDLASELHSLQDNKDFGNPVPQDEWKSDKIGEWFEKGGGLEALSGFDIDDLDAFERFMYDDIAKRNPSMKKAEILKVLINNVEGDFSQLSEKLVSIAKSAKGKFVKGGGVSEKFYEGQSIKLKPIVHSEELKKALPKYNDYADKELVIEEIEYDQPFKRAKAFVKATGEKVPFDIFLNNSNVKQFANGGGLKQKGTTDKKHDKDYKAKRVGYRYTDEFAKKHGLKPNAKPTQAHIDKYLGNGVYFEDRANRSDKSRMKKLKRGGNAGNKTMMQKIQDEVKKLKAENPNMFKKHTDFVKKAAANLKAKGGL